VSFRPGTPLPDEATALLRAAERGALLPQGAEGPPPSLDRTAIEALLPHRGRSLLLDEVWALDPTRRLISAGYDLDPGREVFAEHFPDRPVWPGLLQVEAIGQAGLLLMLHLGREPSAGDPAPHGKAREPFSHALTHVLWARFLRPVEPGGRLEVAAGVVEDGLFHLVVGQCLKGGLVASVAVLSGI
jgi:3-hydroxyacyl-[acyl-carrier-protein] dehydratase